MEQVEMRDRQLLPWGSKRVQHAVQVKAGACRGERVARGDRLPRIEEELGGTALRRLHFSKGERGRAGKEPAS